MKQEINTLPLFPVLDKMLIELLLSLTEDEWEAQTVAKLWCVKDVAAHLLDGNIRALSTSRDGYFGVKPQNIKSYCNLVSFLNDMNMTWTKAAKRMSPEMLIFLLQLTGEQYTQHLHTLNPFDNAVFSVEWAGQETSPNWFHIAREYTEKFLHQQQIRDAVDKPGLMIKELYYPFIDTLMYAFPYTFKNTQAETGTLVSITVTTEIGGSWHIVKEEENWTLHKASFQNATAEVIIDPITAWKLFSKSWSADQVTDKVVIKGDKNLALQALKMVSVMA